MKTILSGGRPPALYIKRRKKKMITNNLVAQPYYAQFCGLSTDSKPLHVAVNSLFLELDTGDIYYFTGATWAKVGA